jgi:hypothetical protein
LFPEIGTTGSGVVAASRGNIYTALQDTITGDNEILVARMPLEPSS